MRGSRRAGGAAGAAVVARISSRPMVTWTVGGAAGEAAAGAGSAMWRISGFTVTGGGGDAGGHRRGGSGPSDGRGGGGRVSLDGEGRETLGDGRDDLARHRVGSDHPDRRVRRRLGGHWSLGGSRAHGLIRWLGRGRPRHRSRARRRPGWLGRWRGDGRGRWPPGHGIAFVFVFAVAVDRPGHERVDAWLQHRFRTTGAGDKAGEHVGHGAPTRSR